jgi:hypothetical protein
MATFREIVEIAGGILALLGGLVLVVFIGLLGGTVLTRIWSNRIDLSKVISEPNGDASMSRFQLMIFTFVIAMSFFIIVVGNKTFAFPEKFPAEVLTLLGISGSSYLVSKAIQFSSPAGVSRPTLMISAPPATPVLPGGTVNLTVSLLGVPAGTALPALTWNLAAPAHGTITPGAPGQATYTASATSSGPGTTQVVQVQAAGFEDGTATIPLA